MMNTTTRAQRVAIHRLWLRARDPSTKNPTSATYRQFRRRIVQGYDCLMINIWGMWIGIERDGYTHS
jgi:hypothetical protein